MARLLFAIVATALCAGCVVNTVPPERSGTQYVPPTEPVVGDSQTLTMYDLESSAQSLIQKMLSSQQFSKNYDAAKPAKDGKPLVVVVGNIANKTTERIQGRLDSIGDAVRAALLESGLFEVKDDEASGAIASRIIRGADSGLEGGSLLESMGTQDPPDFIVLGDVHHFADVGGYHTYKLRLAIHNLKTGKVVWEGIQTKVKL